jgi:hypothetical protein
MDPKTADALTALQKFVDASADLAQAWEKLGSFDVLTESCPAWLPNFDEAVADFIAWRDEAQRFAGLAEGRLF